MNKLLLHDDLVNDFVDAIDLLCELLSSLLLLFAGGEATQLNGSVRGGGSDSGEFVNRVALEYSLDFGTQLPISRFWAYVLDCRTAEGACADRSQHEH